MDSVVGRGVSARAGPGLRGRTVMVHSGISFAGNVDSPEFQEMWRHRKRERAASG